MLLLALGVAMVAQPQLGPGARRDRIAFHRAFLEVERGWSKDRVRTVLGPPDDVWGEGDSGLYVRPGYEVWAYGSDGHLSLPTLGHIEFKGDRIVEIPTRREQPPVPRSVIGDDELFRALRAIHPLRSRRFFAADPLYLVQAANRLRPLGKEKALAVLIEYDRLALRNENRNLFWMTRILFEPKPPSRYLVIPAIGAISPVPPEDLTTWPDYPILLVDGVPFNACQGVLLGGRAEPFSAYVQANAKDWVLRTTPLRPPDDPFLAYRKAIQSPQWKSQFTNPKQARLGTLRDEGHLLEQVLVLVRTAWWPGKPDVYLPSVSDGVVGRNHQAFLASGSRWDQACQVYVRPDGSFTPDDPKPYRQHAHAFTEKGCPRVVASLERTSEREVDLYFRIEEPSSGPTVTVRVVDADDQRVVAKIAGDHGLESVSSVSGIPEGRRLRIEVAVSGKTFRSPAITP